MEENKKFEFYDMSHLTEFRKSIQAMGTSVKNGTIEITPDMLTQRHGPSLPVKPEEVLKTPLSDVKAWRKLSRIYFAHPLYRRLLEYFAYIYYNFYIISPIFGDKKPNKKKLLKDYNAALRTLDEDMKVEKFTTQALLDLLLEGQTFYFNEEYKKGANSYFKPIKLPTDYCKIIGTAGTPAINIYAVDLTFIDTAMAEMTKDNLISQEEVLKQYPKAIRAAYKSFKKGDIDNQWFIVPVENGIAFSTPDGRPPFALLIREIARIQLLEPLKDDYIATNLTKLLVQIIDIDKEGNPEVDLALAAEFHKNLKAVASKKNNVDAITTLAKEIDVLSLGETGDATKNYEFLETYYDQYYKDAGVSSELFDSTTAGTLNESQRRDAMFMYKLREQIAVWFNFYLNAVCEKRIIKNSKFVFSYLDVSYKNREEMMKSYLEGAQYGFSKIVPQVALGVKQRYIESLTAFENDILDLDAKLVPLQSSHTMSLKSDNKTGSQTQTRTGNVEAQEASDKKNGRPELDSDEKKDSTITKEASL
jgi:hypothetical protein